MICFEVCCKLWPECCIYCVGVVGCFFDEADGVGLFEFLVDGAFFELCCGDELL